MAQTTPAHVDHFYKAILAPEERLSLQNRRTLQELAGLARTAPTT